MVKKTDVSYVLSSLNDRDQADLSQWMRYQTDLSSSAPLLCSRRQMWLFGKLGLVEPSGRVTPLGEEVSRLLHEKFEGLQRLARGM